MILLQEIINRMVISVKELKFDDLKKQTNELVEEVYSRWGDNWKNSLQNGTRIRSVYAECINNLSYQAIDALQEGGLDLSELNGLGILIDSISSKSTEMVRYILSKNYNPNSDSLKGFRGYMSALCYSIELGEIDIAIDLIAHGANVNTNNDLQVSPLSTAVRKSQISLVNLLLEEGADVNYIKKNSSKKHGENSLEYALRRMRFNEQSALCIAFNNKNTDILTILLKAGAEISTIPQVDILYSVFRGFNKEIFDELIEYGLDINKKYTFSYRYKKEGCILGTGPC